MNQQQLMQEMRYDPLTGEFTNAWSGHGFWVGDERGTSARHGYIRIVIDGVGYFAHRLAWLYMTGAWPAFEIDHINGAKQDNRWSNLRDVTHTQNMQNVVAPNRNSRTGVRGVSWSAQNQGWIAQIMANGRRQHLGTFKELRDAAAAYANAKVQLHACPLMETAF